MESQLIAKRTRRRCSSCHENSSTMRLTLIYRGRVRHIGYFCAICVTETMDRAFGWKLANNVRQGVVAKTLGAEVRAAKKQRTAIAS